MDVQFVDRLLTCSDCQSEFIFTAGEQLFFHDKQFKNDPKRCKPCKSRRSGLSAAAAGLTGPAAAGLSRTETRTECSECGVETTVPFKPTQGRPVLCRQCFQMKTRAAAAIQPLAALTAAQAEAMAPETVLSAVAGPTATALTEVSQALNGEHLSADAATLAAASMASASPFSSVASAADLASIANLEALETAAPAKSVPAQILAPAEATHAEQLTAESPDA